MKRFFVLAILVGFLLASIAPPVLAVINSLNGMTGTAEIDARAFGVKCDGSTNDKPAFDITGPDAPRIGKSKTPLLTAD